MGIEGRFRHLERARPDGDQPAADEARSDRFENIGPAGEESGEAASNVSPGRFGPAAPAPLPADGTELVAPSQDQPFARCCRCEGDSHVQAVRCVHCGASLETEEQRTFNERLWSRRLAEKQQEEEELRGLEEERRGESAQAAVARRQLGEQLAKEVAERYQRDTRSGPLGGDVPLGTRLLGHIENARWRRAVGVALVAVPLLLVLFSHRGSLPAKVGFVLGFVALLLFLPPRLVRYRRRWWDD